MEKNLPSAEPVHTQPEVRTPPRLTGRQAELKRLEDQQNSWARRRHKSDTVLFRVRECLKALHTILDPGRTGVISGTDLIAQLLSLGLSTDPGAIIRVILAIYKEREIKELRLTLEQMLELSKVDRRTQRVLALLGSMAAEAGSTQSPLRRAGTSLSPTHLLRAAETAPAWREGNLSLSDYMQQLKRLWSDICGPGNTVCEFEHMATVLAQLNVFSDKLEVRKAFPEVAEGSVTFQDFQSVFAKCMFKGALITLAHRLEKGVGGLMTPKMVISLYQRRLLLAGLQGSPDLSREEGQTTLRAVQEYAQHMQDL